MIVRGELRNNVVISPNILIKKAIWKKDKYYIKATSSGGIFLNKYVILCSGNYADIKKEVERYYKALIQGKEKFEFKELYHMGEL
jgi:hypothetical protein